MEKKAFGIILTILGIVGLILFAYYFVNSNGGARNTKAVIVYAVLGAVFFFAGVGLIRTTKDQS